MFTLRGRFSDPSHDFDGMEDELAALAAKPPAELTSADLYLLFNSFLPAGTFEEMAPYVPHALRLLVEDNGRYSGEAPGSAQPELLESLVVWCQVEERELDRRPAFRDAMEAAFMQLFAHWTADTRWHRFSDGNVHLLNQWLVDALLEQGDSLVSLHGRQAYPWLRSERYFAHIAALDTLPHAAWTLRVTDPDYSRYKLPPFELPAERRRQAVEMVEQWLLTDAAPEDAELWEPVATRHREQLYLIPDKA